MPDGNPDSPHKLSLDAAARDIAAHGASPLARYRALRDANAIQADHGQRLAAERLDRLHGVLTGYKPAGESWLGGLKARFGRGRRGDETPRGLYMFGPVGRGKSMLMDLFFDNAPVTKKRRVHFHAFMLEVQDRLNTERRTKQRDDPLMAVAGDIADEAWLLCFDEFHVVNIADAMILGRLFQGLFDHGVVIVATSNVAPLDLYRNGLQRDRFLPFIDLIVDRLDVLDIGDGTDFRLDRLRGRPVWHTPLGAAATAALDAAFATLTDTEPGAPGTPATVELQGRTLEVPRAARGVARLPFAELCGKPRGASDYLALARQFHTVMIDGIPKMTPDQRDVAKRFVVLIDSLYEHRVNLWASADAPPEGLYPAGDTAFEFQRTVSRLSEMQAADYIESAHID
jgi:cell division protein ZapE